MIDVRLLPETVNFLKLAQASEDENNFLDAIGHYNSAIVCFAAAAINDEIEQIDLKEEVKQKLRFCLTSVEKLVILQRNKEKDDSTVQHERIESTCLSKKPNVNFSDVCGMEDLKKDMLLSLILPFNHPELFSGGREPYKAFLLFGPPGTGKSFLAQAAAGEAHCSNFFSVSASDVLSKYVGESEGFIKQLFETARKKKPSIIFIDEIDALACKRTDTDDGRGRSLKTELFAQIEGASVDNEGIFLLASTNTPYDLDDAILRRFDRLWHIALPEELERRNMFKKMLIDEDNKHFSDDNFQKLAEATKGFSGSDIQKACRRANMLTIGRLFDFTHYQVSKEGDSERETYIPCKPGDPGAKQLNILTIPSSGSVSYIPTTTFEDAMNCVRMSKPATVSNIRLIDKFIEERCQSVSKQSSADNYQSLSITQCIIDKIHSFFC